MQIYPAIDLKDQKCVRLLRGEYDKVTVYGDDPESIARGFKAAGAGYIHVVDLDGARDGGGRNKDIIFRIARILPVQTGGGIRSIHTVDEYLKNGVSRVILGTGAVKDPVFLKEAVDKYHDKIVVGIDAKDGYAATDGWEQVSAKKALEFAAELEALGVSTIIYTDVATDGTLGGPNLKAMADMAAHVSMEVIASGGVSCIEDVSALMNTGVSGVIIGKALYTERVNLEEAIALTTKKGG